ncbi:glucosyltransferase [Sporolactobacillus inulinus]|uniref:Glucosyltransferase n=1 Tax=Sporolactobacillus inulinus TaxID=2078 RepID=A0A4Y1ZFJ7_9BACL|nr:DUF6056 family protein [Sporolactobacillus inulinus]GAY77936.1 glucosyltransferase [Sporolactobacillus inulinus]
MRKVSRQLNDSHYMPFLYFILFSLVIHFPMTLNYSDDARFKVILKNNDLFQWLHARYFTWTSRVLLEAVMVPVLHAGDWLWKWIDVLMIAVFVLALSKLFVKSRFAACNWLIILLFLLIPVRAFNSAGWAATTCNYLWPMTMGLIALLPLKKLLNGQRLPYYAYIICIPALIYAANQEQLCVALLIVFGAFIVFFAFQHRFYLFPVIQFLITMASFIFIASSPGNHARLMVQVVRSNHHFFMLSVANKLEIGAFSSTLNHFIFTFDPIFLILCILITAAVYAKIVIHSYAR